MESITDFFSHFSLTMEEIEASLSSVIDGRDFQKPICICGHPMNAHSSASGRTMCSFANTYCRCELPIAVIVTSDLRYFKKLTRGPGANHALSLGCYSALKAGKTVRWLAEPLCFKCKVSGSSIRPVALNSQNRVAFASGEQNVLLCSSCFEEVMLW